MSNQAMVAFLEKAQNDEQLSEKLVSIIGDNEQKDIYPKVVGLAGEYGFTVTEEDVKQVQEECAQAATAIENADGDLSDDDLENVSGGLAVATTAALIGLGAAAVTAGGGITAAVIGRGVNNTVDDIGKFFSRW
ncbi:Nif11-like leader peptide family RiPP precursor [Nisaea sp.]|uniref:Nif11-like leader peptide family RiPP precursor n=1 Tax=Nisaea sp. TaxID=2024842 RepID=UPI003B521CBF